MEAFPHTPTAKASPADIRRINRALIFGLLFPSNQCSRAELGRRTGLSRVAVSDVVGGMLAEGLIRETGPRANATGKGKPGTLLGVDRTRLRIISIDLSREKSVQGAVTDLTGEPLRREEIATGPATHADIDVVARLVDRLREGLDEDRILGVGVSAPGVVQDGMVRASTFLDWHDVDLKGLLERRIGLPVTVGNDVANAMLAERFLGQGGPNMLFVKNDLGIGAATLVGDAMVAGAGHAGGEIGHISIDPEHGPDCPCGKRGCMETLISAHAIRARLAGAADKDARAAIVREAGERFASALAVSVGLLDIADVCVYGPDDVIDDAFIEAAQRRFDRTTASAFRERTVIRRCRCGGDATLRGGAIAVVRERMGLGRP